MSLKSPPEFDEAFAGRLDFLLRWRRDVRHFRTERLPEGMLEAFVARAALAPSVGNSQPWRFVRLADPARRAAVKAEFERCNAAALAGQDGERAEHYSALKLAGMDRAPEHLAVFCDDGTLAGHGLGRATMPETLRYSAVGAVSALWLAARAASAWVGFPSSSLRASPICAWAGLCVGWPETDSNVPELERAGWQARDPRATEILAR